MDNSQIKFRMIEHNSEDYLKCLELRQEIIGHEIDRIEVELERYYIHLVAKKGVNIVAIAILKSIENTCQIKHMYFSTLARNYPFIQEEMLKLCQKIGWFYGFDEMFFECDGCKILLNLEQNLLGERSSDQNYNNYQDRLQNIMIYLIKNKDSLLEYEIDYFLANYHQFFGAVKDEFTRGMMTAMQIKYQFENQHRLELQDTTYGDLLNAIEEMNSDKETIAQSEVFLQQIKQLKVVDPKTTSLDYSKLAKQKHNTDHAIRIIDLLNQKSIDCSSYLGDLIRKNTLCAIANKAYDIFTGNNCTDLTTQSRNIICTNIGLIQSAVEFFYNNNYQEALSQVEKINTEFVAIENIKQAQAVSKPMLGRWTKQLKN